MLLIIKDFIKIILHKFGSLMFNPNCVEPCLDSRTSLQKKISLSLLYSQFKKNSSEKIPISDNVLNMKQLLNNNLK